jgi:hypothetical protein
VDLTGSARHPAQEPAVRQSDRSRLRRQSDRSRLRRQGVDAQCPKHGGISQVRSNQRQHRQIGGGGLDVGPEDHFLEIGQQWFAPPRLGIQVGDLGQFGLLPLILHPTLAVQAEVLGARTIAQVGDVLCADRMQPTAPVATGEGDHRPVRSVHHDRGLLGGALFPEWITEVPDRPDVGGVCWCGNGGHT